MAKKKKKGARTAPARGARKAATKRKRVVKRATAAKAAEFPGLEHPTRIDLTPLKKQLTAHIRRLEGYAEPSPEVVRTLDSLRTVKMQLGSVCGESMVIPTGTTSTTSK